MGYSRDEVMEIVKNREYYLNEDAPHILSELQSIAYASGISYEDILALNLFYEINKSEYLGCTSWVAISSATKNGKTILHKNRDTIKKNQVVIQNDSGDGLNAYIAVTGKGSPSKIGIGVNEHGLAIACNVVLNNFRFNFSNPWGYSGPIFSRLILENCNSVKNAYEWIADNKHKLWNEIILLLADSNEAAVVECKVKYIYFGTRIAVTSWEDSVIDGIDNRPMIAGRTNHFENQYSAHSDNSHTEIRYQQLTDFLNNYYGSLDVLDCINFSRQHYNYDGEQSSSTGSICFHSDSIDYDIITVSAATIEIDDQYPGELTVMWTALGSPCSTPYIPVYLRSAIDGKAIPDQWSDLDDQIGSAYDIANRIRSKRLWMNSDYMTNHFSKLEYQLQSEAERTGNEALGYLILGDGDGINNARMILKNFTIDIAGVWAENALKYISNIEMISYDFLDITESDINFNAYQSDVDCFPFYGMRSYRNDFEECSNTDYEAISSSDNIRWRTDDPGSYDEMILWFEMTIDKSIEDIVGIEFYFEGYSSETNDFNIYALKAGADWSDNSSWIKLGTDMEITSGADGVIIRYTEEPHLYIDENGKITWIVSIPEGHSDSLYIDYVKMNIIKLNN